MYSVKFLSDEEFNQLPADHIETKVGVAYPESGEAFVRKSGSNLVDVFSAMHELEHLHGDSLGEHYDSTNGCYYKGFGDVFQSLAPILGTAFGGPIGGAVGAGIGQIGRGKGQQPQQESQGSYDGMQPFQEQMEPNVVQAPGTGLGAENVGSATGGVKGLASQFNDRQSPGNPLKAFGNYSGRAF